MMKEKDLFEKLEKQFKTLKQKIFNITRSSKKLHYKRYFEENSDNIKKLWEGVNEIIKNRPRQTNRINLIQNNGKNITDEKHIANEFNDFFSGVAGKLLIKRKFPGKKLFTKYLSRVNQNTCYLSPIIVSEIVSIIQSLDNNKSIGPNSIPTKILKQACDILSKPLTDIGNKMFSSGIYPDILKLAKVITIHKKESKTLVSNYRPISLLSNINKIFEKLIHKRLYSFLETNKCIHDFQFGFRGKHSTCDALISITEKRKETLRSGCIGVGVFVDFQKAFDTVNHEILLRKLDHYGLRGISNTL